MLLSVLELRCRNIPFQQEHTVPIRRCFLLLLPLWLHSYFLICWDWRGHTTISWHFQPFFNLLDSLIDRLIVITSSNLMAIMLLLMMIFIFDHSGGWCQANSLLSLQSHLAQVTHHRRSASMIQLKSGPHFALSWIERVARWWPRRRWRWWRRLTRLFFTASLLLLLLWWCHLCFLLILLLCSFLFFL